MRAWLEESLARVWQERGLAATLLWPLSVIHGSVIGIRRALYRRGWLRASRLPVPVVVVGNVVAGGSGKTPVVMAIVGHLKTRGWQVGVVSRGYGRDTQDCREVTADSLAADVGDEPALIRRRCGVPVFVARKRPEAGLALLRRYPETSLIVSDDGLQHLALQRDVEVCVFDDRGSGNGWLLPAGPLREAWPRNADLVVHSGDHPAFAGWHAPRVLDTEAVRADGSRLPLQSLMDVPVLALAGIAHPEVFFRMLRACGLWLQSVIALPDHHGYETWVPPADAPPTWICTEKDAVKLWRRHPHAWAVPMHLLPSPGLFDALDRVLAARVPSAFASDTKALHGQQTT